MPSKDFVFFSKFIKNGNASIFLQNVENLQNV